MTYIPSTPTPKLSFADWQIQFIQNFTQLAKCFAVNHVPLTAATEAGNHTILQMAEQPGSLQVNLSEIAAYSKEVLGQTDQLFLKYQGASGPEFQYTNYQIYPVTTVNPNNEQIQYFTFLPG